jgi:hypothetical protein
VLVKDGLGVAQSLCGRFAVAFHSYLCAVESPQSIALPPSDARFFGGWANDPLG